MKERVNSDTTPFLDGIAIQPSSRIRIQIAIAVVSQIRLVIDVLGTEPHRVQGCNCAICPNRRLVLPSRCDAAEVGGESCDSSPKRQQAGSQMFQKVHNLSDEYLLNDLACDVGEPIATAIVKVSQPLVIHA